MRKFDEIFTVRKLMEHFNMEVINEGNLDFQLKVPSIYHVGYELIGFFDEKGEELNNYLHIFGKKEARFVKTLSHEERAKMWDRYFSYSFPALIITSETKCTEEMLEAAKRNNKTVLKSPMRTTTTIRELKFFLSKELAEEKMINGYMLLEIMGVGVLLTGYEDAKLGVTIELLERGHKLITDNNLIIKRMAENDLEGCNRFDKSQMDSHFFIQNTDGSQIDVTTQFGIKATRNMKRIDMLVVLEEWNEKKFYDRLGIDEVYEEFLGEKILKLVIPVRRGRNLAIILETAALNFRLKMMGVNSAEYFMKESRKLIMANKAKQGENMNEKTLPVKKLKDEFNLKVLHGEEELENRVIKVTGIHRPSLALSGYVDMYEDEGYTGVQLFSKVEFKYLSSLDEAKRIENLKRYLSFKFPVIVLTSDVEVPDYFLELIKETDTILLRAPFRKASQIIANFNGFLETYFAQSLAMHGVFLELYGFGVLLVGRSGIGKSETALELIHRGHRLVADDLVKFVKDVSGDIIGKSATLPYFMEIRGLGIIDIKTLYGLGAVRINKKLDIIIELKEQESNNYMTAVDYQATSSEILGKKIAKFNLYISSGRNAAAMVEIAVMNLMAIKLGHDPEKLYREGLKRMTEAERKLLGE
ncbi:MAG: HPr(Ser) kinase/phosphatase [Fusobacterium sp.]|nr:HPr(Ser) kinase/phosphatase [Fusobacterium sp.]